MIYLFLSGKSSAYLDDIFTTLYLPSGMVHSYKFACMGQSSVVDESAAKDKCEVGNIVLISYVDRTAENAGRFYVPLRYGIMNGCELQDGQIYYDVRLQDYCHAVEMDAYSMSILNKFSRKTYHKRENGKLEGVLAIQNSEPNAEYITENADESWIKTAMVLAERDLFKDCCSIFTKMELTDWRGEAVKPTGKGNYGYHLITGKKYRLRISYYIPAFDADTMATIPVSLEDSREVCGILKRRVYMESKQGKADFWLCPTVKSDMQMTSLALTVKEEEGSPWKIRYAKKAVDVCVKDRMKKGLKVAIVICCLAGIGISSFLMGLPYGDIIKETNALPAGETLSWWSRFVYQICCGLNRYKHVYSSICGAVTTVATFFLVKFTGKAKI